MPLAVLSYSAVLSQPIWGRTPHWLSPWSWGLPVLPVATRQSSALSRKYCQPSLPHATLPADSNISSATITVETEMSAIKRDREAIYMHVMKNSSSRSKVKNECLYLFVNCILIAVSCGSFWKSPRHKIFSLSLTIFNTGDNHILCKGYICVRMYVYRYRCSHLIIIMNKLLHPCFLLVFFEL